MDPDVKCHVIQILGDMITALGADFGKYLEHTMVFVNQAVDVSSAPVDPVSACGPGVDHGLGWKSVRHRLFYSLCCC